MEILLNAIAGTHLRVSGERSVLLSLCSELTSHMKMGDVVDAVGSSAKHLIQGTEFM